MSTTWIRSTLAALVLAPLGSAQDGTYVMEDGLLVVEFESLAAGGHWALEADVPGYTGEGFLRWTGPNLFDEPGHDAFWVEFEVEEAGLYDLRLRNHHDDPDSTESNDVWVRMDGGAWVKLFSGIKCQWTWASNHDFSHDHKPPAQYELSAGTHRLEFSGRSHDFRLDRLHLFTAGHPDGTDPGQPESQMVPVDLRPVARFSVDPPSIPAEDEGQTVIELSASGSYDPEGAPLSYRWHLRGAKFVGGTSATSKLAKVRMTRDGFAQPVRLTVTDESGQTRSLAKTIGVTEHQAEVHGEPVAWHPVELRFHGPATHEDASDPNPFLDHRLDVTWTSPKGDQIVVPGFYAGDGEGGGTGDVWACRFAPDQGGFWNWKASFRIGSEVAIELDPSAGGSAYFDGASGVLAVLDRQDDAEGFLSMGRLEYVGAHYLKFRDGGWFLKGGTNSPENFLGYSGFDDVVDAGGIGIVHDYGPHAQDWLPGDPVFESHTTGVDSGGIIGVLNYLGHQGVNSIYFLPMNMGGDGQETTPFVGYSATDHDRRHYDVSRLHQWAQVMDHAQRCEVLLHVVLAETEPANEAWLDGGTLGVERKLFFRELAARFGHAMALKWNLSEENDYSIQQLEDFAAYLRAVDPYDHPIAVHTHPNDFQDYPHLLGNASFDATSIQYDPALAGSHVEQWRKSSADAGRPWILDMDENGSWNVGLSDSNADIMRKQVLYDVYFSGGQIEWYAGYHDLPLGGDVKLEDFRTRQPMWYYMRVARELMQTLPFWEMEPADELVLEEDDTWGGAECFAKPGEVYAVYLPKGNKSGNLDLTQVAGPATFLQRWFNPRTGEYQGERRVLHAGKIQTLGAPPGLHKEDWVAIVERRK